MKILVVGDVVGQVGVSHIEKTLWKLRNEKKIDFCVLNGENASEIGGLCRNDATRLLDAGADVITLGRDGKATLGVDTIRALKATYPPYPTTLNTRYTLLRTRIQ